MTFFGANLKIVCNELSIPIKKINTYILTESQFGTLYESDFVNSILNVPVDYLNSYNAWILVPGEHLGYYKGSATIEIQDNAVQDKELKVPNSIFVKTKPVKNFTDIISYVTKQYPKNTRIFDIIYTIARLNKMSIEKLLEQFALTH